MKDAQTPSRICSNKGTEGARLRRRVLARCVTAALVGAAGTNLATADHEGLPFTEPFDDAHLSDAAATTADWGGANPGFLTLPAAEPLVNVFDAAATGENVGTVEHTTRDLALGDVNGDGLLDLVEAAVGANGVYLNQGGSFPVRLDLTDDRGNTRAIAIGDINRDGALDVVTGTLNGVPRLYLNSGDGVQYAASEISPTVARTDSIALGDFNGDDWLDVVVADHEFDNNWIYYNTGNPDEPFGAAGVEGVAVGDDRLQNSQAVAVGDLDNDGDDDIVIINELQANFAYLNDGEGNFTPVPIGAEEDNSQAGALGDVNGDGFLDLVVGNFTVSRVYYNAGEGAAEPFSAGTVPVDLAAPVDPSFVHHVVLADVDNDGWLDILLASAGLQAEAPDTRYANWLYLNDGAGNFPSSVDLAVDKDITNAMVAGDVDGDGRLDVIAGNEDRNAEGDALPRMNRLYRNIGTPSGEAPAVQLSAHAASLRVDAEAEPINSVSLDAAFESIVPNVDANFWVSSNGGANWLHIEAGGPPVVFPEGIRGTDLRWRVAIDSLSPAGAAALALDSVTLQSDSPLFTSQPVTAATADSVYVYDVVAVDPNEGDTLTLALAGAAPAWLALTDNGDGTGTLTGTPSAADVGAHDVVIEVADSAGNTGTQSFTIEVAAVEPENQAPAFSSTPAAGATAGTAYAYDVAASDPDGDAVTITAPTLPAWLTFADNGDGTGTLTGTPADGDVGDHEVLLQAADEEGLTADQTFTVTVEAAPAGNEDDEDEEEDPPSNPAPPPPPSSGGGGSAGLLELLGLAGLGAFLGRRRRVARRA